MLGYSPLSALPLSAKRKVFTYDILPPESIVSHSYRKGGNKNKREYDNRELLIAEDGEIFHIAKFFFMIQN